MYVDGYLMAVPTANKDVYRAHATQTAAIFKELGALAVVECWGDEVPDGKLNSMNTAVLRKEDETVVFSWVLWPDKATRDAGNQKAFEDPRMSPETNPMPLDGSRLIYGGFDVIVGP